MIGWIPKSGFRRRMRPHIFPPKKKKRDMGRKAIELATHTDSLIVRDCYHCSKWMHHAFKSWVGTCEDAEEGEVNCENSGLVTCLSIVALDDQILKKEAFIMKTTDRQRLSRIAIESLAIAAVNAKFLLLSSVTANKTLMKDRAACDDHIQNHPPTNLSSSKYYTLQSTISESKDHINIINMDALRICKEATLSLSITAEMAYSRLVLVILIRSMPSHGRRFSQTCLD